MGDSEKRIAKKEVACTNTFYMASATALERLTDALKTSKLQQLRFVSDNYRLSESTIFLKFLGFHYVTTELEVLFGNISLFALDDLVSRRPNYELRQQLSLKDDSLDSKGNFFFVYDLFSLNLSTFVILFPL